MVLTVDSLRDVGDQVKVVLDLGFLLLVLIAVFPSFHAFLLDYLLGPGHLRSVLSFDLFQLLLFQLLYLPVVFVDIVQDLLLVFEHHSFVCF